MALANFENVVSTPTTDSRSWHHHPYHPYHYALVPSPCSSPTKSNSTTTTPSSTTTLVNEPKPASKTGASPGPRVKRILTIISENFTKFFKGISAVEITVTDADWLGPSSFPKLWMYICKAWVMVAVVSLVMPLVVWIMIFIENTKTFSHTMDHYLGNDQAVYDRIDGDPKAGYVANTNIPKHLGGVLFAAAMDMAMWVLIILCMCADLFWKFPICKKFLDTFWAAGLQDERGLPEIEFFFLVANAFLKLFIAAATGSQTYTGLYPDNKQVDTPLFCLYATMILLCSIPLTIIALFFILHSEKLAAFKKNASKGAA